MVSTREVYRIVGIKRISFDREKRSSLGNHFANLASGNTVALESGERFFRRVRSDGHKQAARSLRVEEQILILGGDGGREHDAVAHKGAIVLESAGKMTFARGFDGAREIIEGGMINLEGDCGDAVRRVAERHFAGVAQQAEARDVGDGMNAWCVARFLVDFL